MKSTEKFDRLAARDELQKSGFSLDQANTIVHVIGNAVTTNVASNEELRILSKDLAHRFKIQHNAFQALRDEMRRGFESAREDRQLIRDEIRRRFEAAREDRQLVRNEAQRRYEVARTHHHSKSDELWPGYKPMLAESLKRTSARFELSESRLDASFEKLRVWFLVSQWASVAILIAVL